MCLFYGLTTFMYRLLNGSLCVYLIEAENDEETRMDIMFDRLMLMELRENVIKVDTKAFAELRSYNDPPRIVHDILKAVTAIFSFLETEQGLYDDWQQMKGVGRHWLSVLLWDNNDFTLVILKGIILLLFMNSYADSVFIHVSNL